MKKDYPTAAERLKELTDQLEAGVREVFTSDRYLAYLKTMSKFHRYSFGNVLLIAMQCPSASCVAGFHAWKKNFGRTVKKGEKGIRILAPCPYTRMVETEKIDPHSKRPVLDASGAPVRETVLVHKQAFRPVTVFDISQTEGKELPTLGIRELTGDVAQYDRIIAAVTDLAPVPVRYDVAILQGTSKGCYSHLEQCIYIRPDMSQTQTLKTLIHETAHSMLHAATVENGEITETVKKDRHTREVEAESIAYVVCRHFGIDTAEYSFGYIAGWSKDRELPELRSALECIRSTAAGLIDGIESRCPELLPPEPITEEKSRPERKQR